MVEYEGLPAICFNCGIYGYLKERCRKNVEVKTESVTIKNVISDNHKMVTVLEENYGPWIQVQCWGRRADKKGINLSVQGMATYKENNKKGSCFNVIANLKDGVLTGLNRIVDVSTPK